MTDTATATLVWNGYEVSATVTCVCGEVTKKDIDVGGVIDCARCGRAWRPTRTYVEPVAFSPSPEAIATGALLREAYRVAHALDELDDGGAKDVDWKRLADDLRAAARQLEKFGPDEEDT